MAGLRRVRIPSDFSARAHVPGQGKEGTGIYHAALRVRVREVQEAFRGNHDHLGAGEGQNEVPEVPRLESRAAARWLHGADFEEELSVHKVLESHSPVALCLQRGTP